MHRIPRIAIALRTIVFTIALVALVAHFEHLATFLEILVLAGIISAAAVPAVTYFEGRGQKRLMAVGATFGVALAGLLLVALVMGPLLWEQTHDLAKNLPAYTAKLKGGQAWLQTLTSRFPWLPDLDAAAAAASEHASEALKSSLGIAGKLVTGMVMLVVALVTAFFILLEGKELKAGLLSLAPPQHRELLGEQIGPIVQKLGGYVQGMLISIAALVVYLALLLIICQVPLALVLALGAGFLAVIPLIGGYIGLVPITLVALTVSWQVALVVLVLAYAGNWVVGHVLMPIVFSKSVHLSPLTVMLALLVGAETMGIFGALVAVPIVACLQVLVKNLYIEPMDRNYHLQDGRVKDSEPLRWTLKLDA
ncbi:MAG: tqsA 1 [Cyanobacteria bacterium RYN_339]|nr:tqsA 1 [Cyanobacteria bacterium RYN_339]